MKKEISIVLFLTISLSHHKRLAFWVCLSTIEEAQSPRTKIKVEVRLTTNSDFKPDFENGDGGWLVFYNYETRKWTLCQTLELIVANLFAMPKL